MIACSPRHVVSSLDTGDEIRLKHPCPNIGAPPWTGSGIVVRLNETSEEVQEPMAGLHSPNAATNTCEQARLVCLVATTTNGPLL